MVAEQDFKIPHMLDVATTAGARCEFGALCKHHRGLEAIVVAMVVAALEAADPTMKTNLVLTRR